MEGMIELAIAVGRLEQRVKQLEEQLEKSEDTFAVRRSIYS